jgi:hypothetical protein
MESIEKALNEWQASLCNELDISALYARNPMAHKWKATYRSMCLRETASWRFVDLLTQSLLLHRNGSALGARILLRSALETLAILIYLNQLTLKVVEGQLDWGEFSDKTVTLLSGSRDGSTDHQATSIITVLQKCDVRYPGIENLYATLSECAHPNYEGMRVVYSETDRQNFITHFKNRASELYSSNHLEGIQLAMKIFHTEYNTDWPSAFEALERWLEENDTKLENHQE